MFPFLLYDSIRKLNSFIFFKILLYFFKVISATKWGARTPNPEIKSHMFHPVSRLGAPQIEFYK